MFDWFKRLFKGRAVPAAVEVEATENNKAIVALVRGFLKENGIKDSELYSGFKVSREDWMNTLLGLASKDGRITDTEEILRQKIFGVLFETYRRAIRRKVANDSVSVWRNVCGFESPSNIARMEYSILSDSDDLSYEEMMEPEKDFYALLAAFDRNAAGFSVA